MDYKDDAEYNQDRVEDIIVKEDDKQRLLDDQAEYASLPLHHRLWRQFLQKITPKHSLKYYLDPRNSVVLILVIAVIIVGTTNRVMFRKMLYPLQNYPWYVSQVSTTIYLPVFWPIVWYLQCFTNRITKEMTKFPKWKFLIMGSLDATAGVLMIFGGNKTSGPMQQLLIQFAIPATMFFSILVSLRIVQKCVGDAVNVRYKILHYLGASIIMAGIVVALFPQFQHSSHGNTPFGIAVFIASAIPTALSGVYKEIAFKGVSDMNVFYLNAWVALFQWIVGLLYLPITAIPGFGGISFQDMPSNVWDGTKCMFAGINSLSGDNCTYAGAMMGGYVVANIFYNIILLMLIKYGSAALLYLASAVILPAANISFTFRFIMASKTTKLTPYDIAGLVVILVGLIGYRVAGSSARKPKKADDLEGDGEDDAREAHYVPVFNTIGISEIVRAPEMEPVLPEEHMPRDIDNIRSTYMARLGIRHGNDDRTYDSFSDTGSIHAV